MNFRSVENRVGLFLEDLNLPFGEVELNSRLHVKGFKKVEVNLLSLAKFCITSSVYKRGAKASLAPSVVDCSSFVKWLYGMKGVWLPRRTIQQREMGKKVYLNELVEGDLVFTTGRINYFHSDPEDGVGHVGIYTGNGSVIHAANSKKHVMEVSLEKFAPMYDFRGARRYIPLGRNFVTLICPEEREVECADDVRWVLLQ